MKMLDPTKIAQKWANRVAQSGNEFVQGVQAVTDNPAQKAIAQAAVWQANVANAQARFVSGLQGVTLQSWQNDTANAVNKYTQGSTKGQPKVQNFMSQFGPFLQNAVASLPPRGNTAQNQQRMTQMSTALMKFRVKRAPI
jgi:hypothetical protein